MYLNRSRALSSTAIALATALAAGVSPTIAWAKDAPAPQASDAQNTAQPAADAADPNKIGDIVVTARKRSESSLKVPIAITAFTGAEIEARGIKTMADLAAFTPSLTVNAGAVTGARVDRSNQLFVIRGMSPSSNNNPTTSVFINGSPIGSSDFLQFLDDIDHVEVLKGPQSAYFGRETFAGAVNAATVVPGNTFTGKFAGEVGTRNTYRASGSVTIPVMKDGSLSFRLGGFFDKHDGSYRNANNPSQTLGDQKTFGAHAAVKIQPADNFTIKAFGMIFENDDGPTATGLLLANGPAAFNQANCAINSVTNNFFCGTLPGLTSASPAEATTLTAGQIAFFGNPGGLIKSSDLVHNFGLKRIANHVDASVDWGIPNTGLTLSYLTGFNDSSYSAVVDLAHINGTVTGQYPGYGGFPFLVETVAHDYSHEVRLASDPTKRFRALAGASYIYVYRESINYGLSGAAIAPAPLGPPAVSRTKGVFGSLAFDVTDQLTLTAEGRYQEDTEIAQNVARAVVAQGTSKDFLPRVSVQYKVTPDAMVYATYSKGVNPGVFNSSILGLPTATQQKLASLGVASLVVQPERLTNYEIGFKGRFWGGRATLSITAYYDVWKNQINSNFYIFSPTDVNNPYNVVGFSQYNPANVSTYQYNYSDNSASSKAKGIEIEANVIPVPHVTVNLSGAINDTTYSQFNCTTCAPYSTVTPGFNATGKQLPYSPKYNAALGIQYQHNTDVLGATGWFIRSDYFYHSGIYIQSSNTAKTPDANVFNFRAGLDWKAFSLEAYVNNAFNNKAYTTGFQNSNFAGGFAPAVMVGLPNLVTAGGRVRVKF